MTLSYAALLAQLQGDVAAVDRLASAAIVHSTEHGFPYYLGWAQVLRGWSRAMREADDRAVDEIRGGIALLQSTARPRLPYYRGLLAEACGRAGRVDEALLILDRATEEAKATGERWCEAALNRARLDLRARATQQHAHP